MFSLFVEGGLAFMTILTVLLAAVCRVESSALGKGNRSNCARLRILWHSPRNLPSS